MPLQITMWEVGGYGIFSLMFCLPQCSQEHLVLFDMSWKKKHAARKNAGL